MATKGTKALFIISKSPKPVALHKLNESNNESALSSKNRYILEGVFGVVNSDSNKPNRNDRIYDESEYLPHIQEFRTELSRGIPILGELDHPMDGPEGPRFEVLLKNASHRILDVWYDRATKYVMGKLEILDTPNGKIVKSLIDAGIPIFVSSRAAGYVNPNKHVTIKKIYTWDIVAKPGFEEAKVNLVNESLCESYNSYLDKINYSNAPKDMSIKYNVLNENTSIYEVDTLSTDVDSTVTGQELKVIRPEDPDKLTPHTTIEPQLAKTSSKLGTLSKINAVTYESDDKDSTDSETDKKDSPIKGIEYVSKDAQDKEDESPVVLEIKPEYYNTLSQEEKDKFDKKEKKKDLKKLSKKSESYDDIIEKYSKKEESDKAIKESYAWTSVLKPNQFRTFAGLNESQKEIMTEILRNDKRYFNVMTTLFESDNRTMQEVTFRSLYHDTLNYLRSKKIEDSNWFKLAPAKYKEYYNLCSDEEKNDIQRKAEYFIFESAEEVEDFWINNVGGPALRDQYLTEKENFIYQVPVQILNEMNEEEKYNTLGYSQESIDQIGSLLESYNKSQYTDLIY